MGNCSGDVKSLTNSFNKCNIRNGLIVELLNLCEDVNAVQTRQGNFASLVDPTANDDESSGYLIGSRWVNTVKERSWVCVQNTNGSAIWQYVSGKIGCEAIAATNQTLTTGVAANIELDSENYDTDSLHDNVSNNHRIDIPFTGVYQVSLRAYFTGNVTGDREIKIFKTGADFIRKVEEGLNFNNYMSLSTTLDIEKGLRVFGQAFQDSGSNLDLVGGQPFSSALSINMISGFID